MLYKATCLYVNEQKKGLEQSVPSCGFLAMVTCGGMDKVGDQTVIPFLFYKLLS